VRVEVQASGNTLIKFAVFTPAFRKIWEGSKTATGNTFVEWDLRDRGGAGVANGLYYLRLQVEGPTGTQVRILKVMVLR
jgi:hypothetical protein